MPLRVRQRPHLHGHARPLHLTAATAVQIISIPQRPRNSTSSIRYTRRRSRQRFQHRQRPRQVLSRQPLVDARVAIPVLVHLPLLHSFRRLVQRLRQPVLPHLLLVAGKPKLVEERG